MVWGRPMGSPARREPEPEPPAMPPPTAICARCETTVVLAGKQLPGSWAIVDGEPVCGDCRHVHSATAAMLRQALERRVPDDRAIGEPSSRYRGCRIGHELVLGFAAIQIRAGARPPDGRDEAVSFLADAHAIDELIIELSAIRAELTRKGKANG